MTSIESILKTDFSNSPRPILFLIPLFTKSDVKETSPRGLSYDKYFQKRRTTMELLPEHKCAIICMEEFLRKARIFE